MKNNKKLIIIIAAAIVAIILGVILILTLGGNKKDSDWKNLSDSEKYEKAIENIAKGKYDEAYDIFEDLGDYKDAEEYLSKFRYVNTSQIYNYDGGKLTYNTKFNENGVIVEIEIPEDETIVNFFYDEKGNRIKMEVAINGSKHATFAYTYNSYGDLIKEDIIYYAWNGHTVNEYTYNSSGKVNKCITTDNYGTETTTYTYDSNGNLIEEIGKYSTKTYRYNSNGQLTKVTVDIGYSEDYIEYEYNSQGQLINVIYHDDYEYHVVKYTYDSDGNLIKMIKDYGGEGKYTTTYQYELVYISEDKWNKYADDLISDILEDVSFQ